MSETFEISANGTVQFEESVASVTTPEPYVHLTGIERIAKMVEDPEVAVADISRLIALEIVNIMRLMTPEKMVTGVTTQRDLNDRVKAYRELQRTLNESETLSKKDVLNLDGDKFKFFFGQMIKYFQKALDDVEINPEDARSVMLHFGDTVRAHEGTLRNDLNKIGTGR